MALKRFFGKFNEFHLLSLQNVVLWMGIFAFPQFPLYSAESATLQCQQIFASASQTAGRSSWWSSIGTWLNLETKLDSCRAPCIGIPPLNESLITLRAQENVPEAFSNNTVKILIWNIFKSGKKNFTEEFHFLSRHADIILTQEAYLSDQHAHFFSEIPGFHWDMAMSFYMKGLVPTGVMTGGRAQAQSAQVFRTRDAEPWTGSPKVSLATTYALPNGKKLLVLNLHGINFRETAALQRQLEDFDGLIRSHDGPVFFAGDFNTHLSSRQKVLDDQMMNWSMETAPWDFKLKGPWPAPAPLDHAYSRGLSYKSAQFLPKFQGSDHKPLWVEVVIP